MNNSTKNILAAVFIILTIILTVAAFFYPTLKLRLTFIATLTLPGAMFVKGFPLGMLLKILFSVLFFVMVYTTEPA